MANFNFWNGKPLLGWAIDDWDAFFQAMETEFGDKDAVTRYVNDYLQNSFNEYVLPMFTQAPLSLNLGGKTDKSRIVATSVPQGVFDFSLAAKGLYRVPEYFSEELAQKYPQRFETFGTPSGVIPPNEVRKDSQGFYYKYNDERFPCKIIQKGQIAVDEGVPNAKLKFATRTKKVYLTFKRNRGKVKYVEIYSLFYFTSLSGDAMFAVRHLPALMAAEYLESIGVKVRFYMTRFVMLDSKYQTRIRENWTQNQNVELPLYKEGGSRRYEYYLLVQPIIAKDFGEEINYPLFFCISSQEYRRLYYGAANYTFDQELNRRLEVGGYPNWSQIQYREGFERYMNKYRIYNNLGIFKSKEILPEAMIFFHDMVIKNKFYEFAYEVSKYTIEGMAIGQNSNEITKFVSTDVIISPFFNWWMRLSANNLKNKVILINSNELIKDIKDIQNQITDLFFELDNIIDAIPDPTTVNGIAQYTHNGVSLKHFLINYGEDLMMPTVIDRNNEDNSVYGYNIINKKGQVDVKVHVNNIIGEITAYADGLFFESDEETRERRDAMVNEITEALQKI